MNLLVWSVTGVPTYIACSKHRIWSFTSVSHTDELVDLDELVDSPEWTQSLMEAFQHFPVGIGRVGSIQSSDSLRSLTTNICRSLEETGPPPLSPSPWRKGFNVTCMRSEKLETSRVFVWNMHPKKRGSFPVQVICNPPKKRWVNLFAPKDQPVLGLQRLGGLPTNCF